MGLVTCNANGSIKNIRPLKQRPKTPSKTKTSKTKTSKMKTYSKTKTHAKTQLMRKVLKRLDNLRENRESVKQTSIRLGIPYYRKLTIHFINVEFYIQGTIINCKLDYYVHLPIKYFVVLCDLMVFDLI